MPLAQWVSERFGSKRVWLCCLGVFLVGSVLAGAAWDMASLIVFRLVQGAAAGVMWPLLTTMGFAAVKAWAPLAGGLALTAAFVIHALRRRSNPLINVRLLRVRSFAAATAVQFLAGLSVYGPLLLIALFYQDVQGKSAVAAGLLLAPQGIGSLIPRSVAQAPSATYRPRTCPTRAAPPGSFSRSAGHSVPPSWP